MIAAAFLAWLTVQLAVPTTVLNSDPNPDPDHYRYRFGWQMFTGTALGFRYSATMGDGRTRRIDPVGEVGLLWGNVHYGTATFTRLCDVDRRRVKIARYALNRREERKAEASFWCR